MRIGFSNKNFDTVMIMDAILISLACVLVLLAYREITQAPFRHVYSMGDALMTVSDDYPAMNAVMGDVLDRNKKNDLTRQLERTSQELRLREPGAELLVFSDHPALKDISSEPDSFRAESLKQARSGDTDRKEQLFDIGGQTFYRIVAPVRAQSDCRNCSVLGLPSFRQGDVLALREIILPVGNQFADTVHKLLLACGMLAASLMVYLGLVIPMFRQKRHEHAQINDRAMSLEKQATTDPLTGLFNRRYFETALVSYLQEFNAINSSLGLLILDIDHFKKVNDTYGHDSGDLVLREVGHKLKSITRGHDIVARIGGEEFAVIAPYATHQQLLSVAERYRANIQALKIDLGVTILRPTVSIGVATNAGGVSQIEELFKAADRKLYEAKHDGRNRVAA